MASIAGLTHDGIRSLYGEMLSKSIGAHKIACIPEVSCEELGLVDKGAPLKVALDVLKKYRATFSGRVGYIHAARCTTTLGRPVIALVIAEDREEIVWTIYRAKELFDPPCPMGDYDFTVSTSDIDGMFVPFLVKNLIKKAGKTIANSLEKTKDIDASPAKKIKTGGNCH